MAAQTPKPFPENNLGLERGTVLVAKQAVLGLLVGQKIPIGYDDQYICSGGFTWDIDQLVAEINAGIWDIDGSVDLTNQIVQDLFGRLVEGRRAVN